MDERRNLAVVSGRAGIAKQTIESVEIGLSARLAEAPFARGLGAELREMSERMEEVTGDLEALAGANDSDDSYFAGIRHRLANRGKDPAPAADAEQLAAIEEAAAA